MDEEIVISRGGNTVMKLDADEQALMEEIEISVPKPQPVRRPVDPKRPRPQQPQEPMDAFVNPNKQTAVDQLPLLRDWLAYPGDKGLAITQVIYDGMEKLATGEASDVADLQEEMAEEAGDLMPR